DRFLAAKRAWASTQRSLTAAAPRLTIDESVATELAALPKAAGRSREDQELVDIAAWWQIEANVACTFAQVSARNFEQDSAFDGAYRLMTSGVDATPKGLATGLDIHLPEPVTKVAQDDRGVVVTTGKGEYTADYAVVTVSLGALQSGAIAFDPPPPAAWQAAV